MIDELVAGPNDSPLRAFLIAQLLDDVTRDNIRGEREGPGPTLRRVLIAARQWEIVAEERLPDWTGPDLRQQILKAVSEYRTGAETMRDADTRDEIRVRLKGIADATGDVIVYNRQLHLEGKSFETPGTRRSSDGYPASCSTGSATSRSGGSRGVRRVCRAGAADP